MMTPALRSRLGRVARRQAAVRLWSKLGGVWVVAAILGLGWASLARYAGWRASWAMPGLVLFGVLGAIVVIARHSRREPDWRDLARRVENQHPELDGRLVTAVQIVAKVGESLGYLEERVVTEAVAHADRHDWRPAVPASWVWLARGGHLLALGFFGLVIWNLQLPAKPGPASGVARSGVVVTPGDAAIERGSSLVVMARFPGQIPANVELVLGAGSAGERRLPLVRSLADPLLGITVPDVKEGFEYHVAYGRERTRDFAVTVFEHPRLDRADAELTYPAYTGLAPKRIENTQRVTAVEGTRLELTLQLNKPVVSARLVVKDTHQPPVILDVITNQARATLAAFPLEVSRSYQLQLVDADGRTNKVPALFVFSVVSNRPPELKLASPRGDLRPSPLEEISFAGTVWDDFGVQAYGLGIIRAGEEPQAIELGRTVPAKEKRPFQHLVRLEELGVQPDEVVSWYAYADDLGPDGQVRRTTTDLFFAEVRPFDEIFREGQGNDAANSGPSPEEGGRNGEDEGNGPGRLAELQKQIVSATWRLLRDVGPGEGRTPRPPRYAEDAGVVRDAQQQVRAQAETARDEVDDPRSLALWQNAVNEMTRAVEQLDRAPESPAALRAAFPPEQAAYQALLRLQEREFSVAQRRNPRGNPSNSRSRQQAMQRQLDQLDLAQNEDRYETERQAQRPPTAERREQLQILNRLQELARRQQDLNERLQELQTALQEARTEADRDQVRRQLQRLQEDERQMMADLDELQQRLDRPENQSRLAEQRRQLEQTRQDLQRAAEAAEDGQVSQALAAGARAQRQMQQMRDDLRREQAGEFAEDLREMRAAARDLARRQEQIDQRLEDVTRQERQSLDSATPRQALLEQLTEQKQRLTNLVERSTQLSQQTEQAEPLVSRELYDMLRQFSQDEARNVKEMRESLLDRGLLTYSLDDRLTQTAEKEEAKSLELTAEMLRQGYLPQADEAETRARRGIVNLRQSVERAAERVLGDDTEGLRLAQRQLGELTEQLEREIARAEGTGTNQTAAAQGRSEPSQRAPAPTESSAPEDAARSGQAQAQPGDDRRSVGLAERQGEASGREPGEREDPRLAQREPGQRSRDRQDQGQAERGDGSMQDAPADRAGRDGRQPGETAQTARAGQDAARRGGATGPGGRGAWLGGELDDWLGEGPVPDTGPILGDDFAPWSDRLREVEELVELPGWRDDVSSARERARQIRQDFRRNQKKPDWAVVRLHVVKPLVEVRNQIAEELARREPRDQLVPIDRDPVPTRFSELVRRYYEELGKDR